MLIVDNGRRLSPFSNGDTRRRTAFEKKKELRKKIEKASFGIKESRFVPHSIASQPAAALPLSLRGVPSNRYY